MVLTLASRVTGIEGFRYFSERMKSDSADDTIVEQYLTEIRTPPLPNVRMRKGTAFHSIMESPARYRIASQDGGRYTCGELSVSERDMAQCLETTTRHGVFETPGYKWYTLADGTKLLITGTCDYMLGKEIHDFKTRWFDGKEWTVFDDNMLREKYEASMQWKLYLDLFDCDTFRYKVYVFRDGDPAELVRIKQDIVCERYDGMERDILDTLEEWYEFMRRHDCLRHFPVNERAKLFLENSF